MKGFPWRPRLLVLMLCAPGFLIPLAGTALSRSYAQSETQGPQITVNRIAVVPLVKGRYGTSVSETLDVPLFQLSPDTEGLDEDSDRILTEYVFQEVQRIHGSRVIPLDTSVGAYFRAPKDELTDTMRTLARKTGEALRADLVMTGFVWRYKNRVGGDRAASSPASVGFDLILIHTADGKMLWTERFEETQRALSENILNAKTFLDRGGKWVTAEELAKEGLREIFKKYPYR